MTTSVADAVRWMCSQGLVPMPLPAGSKKAVLSDWPNYQPREEDFPDNANVGLVLGPRSGDLADVDFDWPEAAQIGLRLLSPSWRFGRRGSGPDAAVRVTHVLYVSPGAKFMQLNGPKSVPAEKRCIIELRAEGRYTVVPPSRLDEDQLTWVADGNSVPICHVPADELSRLVSIIAGCALLVRIWGDLNGARHNVALALAGACLHAGWPADEVLSVLSVLFETVADEEREDRIGAVRDSISHFAARETTVGLPTLAQYLPDDVVACLRKWWGLGGSGGGVGGRPSTSQVAYPRVKVPLPSVLPGDLRAVPPFPMGCLPNTYRPYVADVADRMQCPVDFIAVALMVVTGAVIGAKVAVRPKQHDDWEEVANLWGGVVAPPGQLKSPALAEVLSFLRELESAAKSVYDSEYRDFEVAQTLYEHRERGIIKPKGRGGQDQHPDKAVVASLLADRPVAPVRKRYILSDSTYEKAAALMAENPNGLLLFRDELMGFIGVLDDERHAAARKFYLESHNGTLSTTIDRIARGTIDIPQLCLSVLGGIQPGPLLRYQHQAVRGGARDDGLFQRFQLLVWPDVRDSSRLVDRAPDYIAYNNVREVLTRLDKMDPKAIVEPPRYAVVLPTGVDYRPALRFRTEAQERFVEWWAELHQYLGACESEALTSHVAKFRGLIPKLALVIHLVDAGRGSITRAALEKAIGWYHHLLAHAERIYSYAPDQAMRGARLILERLESLPDRFTAREVQAKGWSGLSSRDDVAAALEVLVEYGHLDAVARESTVRGGRPTVEYQKRAS